MLKSALTIAGKGILAFVVIGLAGCATAAQQQATQIKNVLQQAKNDAAECGASVYNKPEYASIVSHLPAPGVYKPDISLLADDAKPTAEESKLLVSLHNDMIPCKEELLVKTNSVAPKLANIGANTMVESDRLMIPLVKRKTTWGEYNTQRQKLVDDAIKKMTLVLKQMTADLKASNQAELNQRQSQIDSTIDTSQKIAEALLKWSIVLLEAQQLRNAAQPSSNVRIMCTNNSMASGTMPNPTLCQSY